MILLIHQFDNPFHQPVQVLFHNVWVDIIMDSVDTNSVSVSDWQRKYWFKISNCETFTSITRGKMIFARCWARLNQFQTQSWVKYLGIIILFGWYVIVCKKNKTKLNINFSLLARCMVFVELCSNFSPRR